MRAAAPRQRGYVDLLLVIVGLAGLAIFATTCALVYLLIKENEAWTTYAKQHNCKVVARVTGDTFNTVGLSPSGQVVVGVGSLPGKTGWLCDDGITYYR